ncbi:MAG: alpha/beta hydrolase, partial [Alphaproteobacteria bacterium]|nr:alpha/beta hydrolase [Alphaproteobacteria bacterium]
GMRAADGTALPMRAWLPAGEPRAVVLALHGFNDYSRAFERPGRYWRDQGGIALYAYDQRGFGANRSVGIWPGTAALVADAAGAIRALRARHAGRPLYLLGESMGGAVALALLAEADAPPVDGAILVAPAVWGWSTMNPFYRAGLWFGAHTTPWATWTGRGFGRVASDNYSMLLELSRDPLVIKQTRTDAVYGVVELMDRGLEAAARLAVPSLIVYGERDEIIPRHAARRMLERTDGRARLAVYPRGCHMALRDLDAETVYRDVLAWLADAKTALPSGAEREGRQRIAADGGLTGLPPLRCELKRPETAG